MKKEIQAQYADGIQARNDAEGAEKLALMEDTDPSVTAMMVHVMTRLASEPPAS